MRQQNFDDLLLRRRFPQHEGMQAVGSRDDAANDIVWMKEIRNCLLSISEYYSSRQQSMPTEILRTNLDAASSALNLVINNEVQVVSKPTSPQEKMKVLPEQILAWLKSTFGQEGVNQNDDKKRTFRGVVAAMRVIYGFKGKKLSRHQSGSQFLRPFCNTFSHHNRCR